MKPTLVFCFLSGNLKQNPYCLTLVCIVISECLGTSWIKWKWKMTCESESDAFHPFVDVQPEDMMTSSFALQVDFYPATLHTNIDVNTRIQIKYLPLLLGSAQSTCISLQKTTPSMHFQSCWHLLTILCKALLSANTVEADGVVKVIPHTVPPRCMQNT